MPEYEDEKIPVIFIEITDQMDSGFILDGTEGTPNEVQLRSASVTTIPSIGYRKGVKARLGHDGKPMLKDGQPVMQEYNELIRFIRNETEISVQRQKELGIEPNNKNDKIVIEKGSVTVARDAGNIGLFDYLVESFYNASNKKRSNKATALYKIVEKDKEDEESIELAFIIKDATEYVSKLRMKVGKKDGKDTYKYNEEKINGICDLLHVWAESYPGKIKGILEFAKNKPKDFMEEVTRWEQMTETEVSHMVQLGVIIFDKNVVQSKTKEKVYKSLGTENLSKEQKIERFADYLRTSEGKDAYGELKAELEAAKEKALK